MHLKRIEVRGYRASANSPIVCELPGRFSLILGANGSGKTTINEAIALAHPRSFPRLAPIDATALGAPPRMVRITYEFETDVSNEGALGAYRKRRGLSAPQWCRPLERSLGRVRAGQPLESSDEYDSIRLVHLPALRNPVDDLSRRDARVLLELLRADERKHPETGGLRSLRARAEGMLNSLTKHPLVGNVEDRIAENLRIISGGVKEHHAFVGTQTVDDTYLARVFEMLVALLPDRMTAQLSLSPAFQMQEAHQFLTFLQLTAKIQMRMRGQHLWQRTMNLPGRREKDLLGLWKPRMPMQTRSTPSSSTQRS